MRSATGASPLFEHFTQKCAQVSERNLDVPVSLTIEDMERLPTCSGAEAVRAFERGGWATVRRKGSHVSLTKLGSTLVLTVPMHTEIGRGLLRSLIRKAGISVDEFMAFLNG